LEVKFLYIRRAIMFSKKIILGLVSGLFVLATANSYAAQMQVSVNDVVAREAAEGPRGADNERPGDRQRRGGRLTNDSGADILARRGADDPVGSERPGEVHGQKRGGRLIDDASSMILAREAAEGPRGADNNNQRRRGRA
jgi:hypothetical protein